MLIFCTENQHIFRQINVKFKKSKELISRKMVLHNWVSDLGEFFVKSIRNKNNVKVMLVVTSLLWSFREIMLIANSAQCTLLKNEKFTLIKTFFRQIYSIVIYLVNVMLSWNFCKNFVKALVLLKKILNTHCFGY